MAVQDVARIDERLDRAKAGATLVSDQVGGVLFQNMAEVMEFAKLMAKADIAIPNHLRENPGACLRIVTQALEWRMSPFSVAEQSYKVGDKIGYMAQLIHAVIEQRAPIVGRMRHRFDGEGDDRVCIVWAQVRGEADPLEYKSPPFGKIQPKNSPLWKTKPDLQQYYNTSRDFCRVYFPDVLLGVYAEDELRDHHVGADRAKDITPKPDIANRLTKSKGRRGFDADHVERETKPIEPEAQGSTAPEPQAFVEASASPADANGAADTPGTPAAPQLYGSCGFILGADANMEIAGETLDKPASGAEARAAGDAQGSDGGSPSYYLNPFPPNIWAQYADWFVDKHTLSDIRKADTAWWKSHQWPDDDGLKDKHRRIRKIHERRASNEIDADQFTAQIREAVQS